MTRRNAVTAAVILALALVPSAASASTQRPAATIPPGGCIQVPEPACGFPNDYNTGPQRGAILTDVPSEATSGPGWSYSGNLVTVTGNVGSRLTGLQLAPGVEVYVPNGVSHITLDNLVLTGLEGENDNGITIGSNTCQAEGCGPTHITVENCYIHALNDTTGAVGGGVFATWQSESITVRNCNIAGTAGAIYFDNEAGHDVTTGNYISDPGAIPGDGQHLNGIGDDAGPAIPGSSWLIQHNTILMTGTNGSNVTAAVSLFPDFGDQVGDNVTINDNLLDSGNYYLIDNGYGNSDGQSGIAITNNRLGDSGNNAGADYYSWYIFPNLPGCGYGTADCAGDTESGNVWDATGATADSR